MSRKDFCDYDRDRTVMEIVYETVTFFRNKGHKGDAPFEQASLTLGISQRKTWSVFYGQAFTFLDCEVNRIRARFVAHLEWQAEDYVRRSDALKAKIKQMELGV